MPRFKKLILIVLLLLLSALLYNVYAGKSAISLNAPVSFPVDI